MFRVVAAPVLTDLHYITAVDATKEGTKHGNRGGVNQNSLMQGTPVFSAKGRVRRLRHCDSGGVVDCYAEFVMPRRRCRPGLARWPNPLMAHDHAGAGRT
jgi:hypothetical protein